MYCGEIGQVDVGGVGFQDQVGCYDFGCFEVGDQCVGEEVWVIYGDDVLLDVEIGIGYGQVVQFYGEWC